MTPRSRGSTGATAVASCGRAQVGYETEFILLEPRPDGPDGDLRPVSAGQYCQSRSLDDMSPSATPLRSPDCPWPFRAAASQLRVVSQGPRGTECHVHTTAQPADMSLSERRVGLRVYTADAGS